MGEFKPKINQPLEGVEHARWLERERERVRKELAAVRAEQSRQAQNTASLGRRTIRTRSAAQTSYGLPEGGTSGNIVRKVDAANGNATWTTEWQGLMPEYWVTLAAAGASYYVSGMGLATVTADDQDLVKTLVPPVEFSDDGLTMHAIDFGNYSDSFGAVGSSGQAPIHLFVAVYPAFDGEEFTIYLPTHDNYNGVTTPFYTFGLDVIGPYSAVVNIADTLMFYEGTRIPVMGDTYIWTLDAGAQGAWFVRNVKGWGAFATPVFYDDGGDGYFTDSFYSANIAAMRYQFSVPKDGALSVAAIPRRTYNDTIGDLTIGKVTASVGTAPSGADLTLVVKKNGTSITTTFTVADGTNAGTAVLSDTTWAVGDYLTIEVTQTGSAADLNAQIWAG